LNVEELPTGSPILFTACCKGEASIVFGSTFVPSEIHNTSINRGISVQKIIQRVDFGGKIMGGHISSAKLGDRLKITIEIIVTDSTTLLSVVDPLSGAYEPIDEGVSSSQSPIPTYDPWFWRIWHVFSYREYKRDKVIIYGQNVWAGTHSVSYYASVTNEGLFVVPPTKAFDVRQPEVMGLSAGGVFMTSQLPKDSVPTNSTCLPWKKRQLVISDLPPWMKHAFQPIEIEIPPIPTTNTSLTDESNGSLLPILYAGAGVICIVIAFILVVISWRQFTSLNRVQQEQGFTLPSPVFRGPVDPFREE